MPKLLDLFCGAGGAAVGYSRAGFDVTGVDIARQPRYPFCFIQADALEYLAAHGPEFDVIHASPPCQAYSRMRRIKRNQRVDHPKLIPELQRQLRALGRPYVIENVEGAPLDNPTTLCGLSFGMRLYRHRLFESSHLILAPPHSRHIYPARSCSQLAQVPDMSAVLIYNSGSKTRAIGLEMGCDWMSRDEMAEAVPPVFTEHIGRQLLAT